MTYSFRQAPDAPVASSSDRRINCRPQIWYVRFIVVSWRLVPFGSPSRSRRAYRVTSSASQACFYGNARVLSCCHLRCPVQFHGTAQSGQHPAYREVAVPPSLVPPPSLARSRCGASSGGWVNAPRHLRKTLAKAVSAGRNSQYSQPSGLCGVAAENRKASIPSLLRQRKRLLCLASSIALVC